MKNILFVPLLLLLLLVNQNQSASFFPVVKYTSTNRTSVIFKYGFDLPYYSSWITKPADPSDTFSFNFDCTNSPDKDNNRVCQLNLKDEDFSNFKNIVDGCITTPADNTINCENFLPLKSLPNPYVTPDFRPTTNGGKQTIQGYYLYFVQSGTSYTLYPHYTVPILGSTGDISFDPTKIDINFPSGCGKLSFLWPNGNFYNFSYGNPNISNYSYNESIITIEGINFSNNVSGVSITIDNKDIQPTNVISIDHGTIKIKSVQKYTNKSLLKINVCSLVSNEFTLFFRPKVLSINSVPKSKGGLVTIIGERLSSLNNSDPIVKIGESVCNNVVHSTDSQIICEIKPLVETSPSSNLPIFVSIDGIENKFNSLLFSFDIPWISNDYTLPEGILNLKGNCFGNSSKTKILINDIETNVTNLIINEKETELSFQLLLKSANVSILVNGIKSNIIQVDGSFYAKVNESSPSVNGQSVEYTLYNIKPSNYDLVPTITFRNDNTTINGIVKKLSSSSDRSIQIFQFQIPKGCGQIETIIKIGDQSSPSKFYYKTPTIDKCSVESNQSIVCDGNFIDYQNLYQNKFIKLKLSNNYIDMVVFNSNHLLFPLIPQYESSDLYIEVCNQLSVPYKLDIKPTLKDVPDTQLKSIGGTAFINGQNFNTNCANDTYFECDDQISNETSKFNCLYQNYTSISCDLLLKGPKDRTCELTFNGEKSGNKIKVSFYPPLVLKVANTITASKGGILTIIGDQFYDNSSDISISVDKQTCFNPKYINSTTITCQLNSITSTTGSKSTETTSNVNVNINGKSGYSNLLVYLNDSEQTETTTTSKNNDHSQSIDNSHNIQAKKKLKTGEIAGIVIGSFVFVVAATGLLFFVLTNDERRRKRKNKEAIKRHENELEIYRMVSRQLEIPFTPNISEKSSVI